MTYDFDDVGLLRRDVQALKNWAQRAPAEDAAELKVAHQAGKLVNLPFEDNGHFLLWWHIW